ncbi:hypothetical protein H0194_02325 [Corynebacterium incognita]|uniref:Uncharacterized protein n=1 Tax=Corynebacterium incognita TaxID=2754725 RepID=A0A7G7CLU6_9CORY|nr:hypothetical protein [Corynebacterium incognita]QNE88562.1 hypothetical protein H0194_02325 [Corynebacterium incognita]
MGFKDLFKKNQSQDCCAVEIVPDEGEEQETGGQATDCSTEESKGCE